MTTTATPKNNRLPRTGGGLILLGFTAFVLGSIVAGLFGDRIYDMDAPLRIVLSPVVALANLALLASPFAIVAGLVLAGIGLVRR